MSDTSFQDGIENYGSGRNYTLIHFMYLKHCLSELSDPGGLLLKALVPKGYSGLAESLSLSLLLLLSVTIVLEPFVSSVNIEIEMTQVKKQIMLFMQHVDRKA